jgi:hypothetical protein
MPVGEYLLSMHVLELSWLYGIPFFISVLSHEEPTMILVFTQVPVLGEEMFELFCQFM